MRNVRLDELEPGMILAEDLTASDGRLLFKAGVELEDRHIDMLRRVGVDEVSVQPPMAELSPEQLGDVEDYVREFFLYADPDFPPSVELFRIMLEQTGRAVAQGWELPSLDQRRAVNVEHMEDLFFTGLGDPEAIVQHEASLASFPDIYFRIREALDDKTASADRIAEVVSADMSLTAKLIKLVNSPLYSFSQEIDSVSRAVALAGAKELSTLALGISAINYFKDIPPELIDMRTFWRHSITCGVFAKIVASRHPGLAPERFFTAGLLHDVGRLILFKKLPYASTEAMLFARENTIPLVEAEREVVGFTHTDVSKPLLVSWSFPAPLADLVNFHHEPMAAPNPMEAAVVHLADNLANAAEISQGGMYLLPGIQKDAWNQLSLSPDALPEVMDECQSQIDVILNAFF